MRTMIRLLSIAILFCMVCALSSCEKPAPSSRLIASNHPLYDPDVALPEAVRISDRLKHDARVAIVLRRVVEDTHKLKPKYADERVRILLEIVAGDSGIDPRKLDIRAPLKDPPTRYDSPARIETIMKAEVILEVEISEGEFGPGARNLSVQGLIDLLE